MFAAKTHDVAVTQIMSFDERNGCFERFMGFTAMLYDDIFLPFYGDILIHFHIGRGPKH